MKILIVEDDLSSRRFLYKFMSDYGDCDITVDGIEALDAYMLALDDKELYDLICIDIMMPSGRDQSPENHQKNRRTKRY